MGIYNISSLPYSSLKYSIPIIVVGSIILGMILYYAVYRDHGVWLGGRISAGVWAVCKGFYFAVHAPGWAYDRVKEKREAMTEGWGDWSEKRGLENEERMDGQVKEKEGKRKEKEEKEVHKLERKRGMVEVEAIYFGIFIQSPALPGEALKAVQAETTTALHTRSFKDRCMTMASITLSPASNSVSQTALITSLTALASSVPAPSVSASTTSFQVSNCTTLPSATSNNPTSTRSAHHYIEKEFDFY
ncbi:uncharacterized protein PAC_14152 [Phialocephala subalpina]|uniref:Uncharacterized protein n=1 Tax=Phialocephala subalpina TaxID=576137 RepID=A0A1L7XGV7_9HELO|nr:uncharacterized protein PAC_14152 [Phialocephala subalpina]